MKWDQLFMVNGRVRPGWRFFFAAVMIVLAHLVVGVVLGLLSATFHGHLPHFLFWANLLSLLALLAVFKFLTSFFEEKPLGSIGLAFHARWKTELGIGLALGSAMILVVAVLEWGMGWAQFARNSISASSVLEAGAYYALLFAVAATSEELIFRGYAFQRLIESLGPVAAVVLTSFLFGVIHLENPSHSWLSTFNTALIGIPLAGAYLRTRALWLPIGIHAAWNFVEGYALGFPVSGLQFPRSIVVAHVRGSLWLTGGAYGPEGSLLAATVIGIATVYLLFSPRIYITEEMRELAAGAPKSPPENRTASEVTRVANIDSTNVSLHGGN